MMLRQSRRLGMLAALVATLAAAGCGIKGPLVPAAKPDAATEAAKDSRATTPKKP